MTMKGVDILGAADNDWNRKETAIAIDSGFGFGLFHDTFGDGFAATKEILTIRKNVGLITPFFRLQFWRAHALTETSVLQKCLPKYQELSKQFDTKFYISHSCEYSSQDVKEVKKRIDLIRKLAPNCTPVLSPWKGVTIPGVQVEVHGKTVAKKGQGISYDGGSKGEAVYDIDAPKWIKQSEDNGADYILAWGPRFNLTETYGGAKPPPPSERTAAPSGKFVKGVCRLFADPGPVPSANFKFNSLKGEQLLKTWAEDMEGNNPRDNLPVLMVPDVAGAAICITCTGQQICALPRYNDPKPHKLERYYSGLGPKLYAWEIADKAKALSGSPWYWIKFPNKIYGPFTWLRTPFFQA